MNNQWITTTVDSGLDNLLPPALALNSEGDPQIAYYANGGSALCGLVGQHVDHTSRGESPQCGSGGRLSDGRDGPTPSELL